MSFMDILAHFAGLFNPACYLTLTFNEEELLHHKGKVTAVIAKAFAENEFEKYRAIQDRQYQSDFDRLDASTEKKD